MRSFSVLVVLVAAFAPGTVTAQSPRDKEVAALIAKYQSEMDAFLKAPNRDLAKSPRRLYPKKFLSFAQLKNDDASLKACEFITLKFYLDHSRYTATELALKQHRKKRMFPQFVGNLVYKYDDDPRVDAYLSNLAKSTDPIPKSVALYQQARLIIDRRDWLQDEPERYDDILPDSLIRDLQSDGSKKRAKQLLAQVIELAPNVKYLHDSDRPLVAFATQDLFVLEQLQCGDKIPPVSGKDSENRRFSISDYQGKIVVVTFWAGWCGGCMRDLPHEVEFVESMTGRPFVWLGVNGDKDLDSLKKLELKHKVNFRSWHDGENGPIARQFGVHGWPAMWVIDHEGVIRYRSGASVDLKLAKPAIEKLVTDLERHNKAVNRSAQSRGN